LISPFGSSISSACVTLPSFFTLIVLPGSTDADAGLSLNSVSEIAADEELPDEPLLVCRFSPQPANARAAARANTTGEEARIT
jgi:hypothetical protein